MTDGCPPARSGPLLGSVLGRYALVRWLGEGGMGSVYEATHEELGKRAAIKTLHERLAASPEARQRFLREGRAAAQIQHAHVADVYDVAIDGLHPYLVMELLEGEDLSHCLSREAPLSVQRTADLLVPVIAAVAAAHDLGIVHRDLKPENIFLTSGRSGVVPKVVDFGISKLSGAEAPSVLTGTGALLGTPHYMSPEQAQGDRQIDVRSDQYSLGVILYQCVTGRRPLQGIALYALMQRTVHGDFPPPRQVHPALPRAFEELILRAMARQPERRFASTRAFGTALLEFASDGVRTAFARELSSVAHPVPGGVATPPSETRQVPRATADEMSTTLGESAQERWVAATNPRSRRRGVLAGASLAVGLLGAGLLAVGLLVGRFGQLEPPPAVSAPRAPDVSAALPLRPSVQQSAQESAESSAAALLRAAEQSLAQGQLASAVDGFRRAYAIVLDARLLQRAAEVQTELWRQAPSAERCRQARELWLAHGAVSDASARPLSRAALRELAECAQRVPVARAVAGARGAVPPARSVLPDVLPDAPAAAASRAPPAALTLPLKDLPSKDLPSEDPEDGFLEIAPAAPAAL